MWNQNHSIIHTLFTFKKIALMFWCWPSLQVGKQQKLSQLYFGISPKYFCFHHSCCRTLGIHGASPPFSRHYGLDSVSQGQGGEVEKLCHHSFFRLCLFALRQILSAVTYPRLPFHLLFDLMCRNEGKWLKTTTTHLMGAPIKPLSLSQCSPDPAQGEDTRPPDRLPGCRFIYLVPNY